MKNILIILTLVLASCASAKKSSSNVLDNTIGKTEHEMIVLLGPPLSSSSDGSDGKILTWVMNGVIPQYGTAPIPIKEYLYLYFNKDGIVYHWKTNQQTVPPVDVIIR